jgi:RNA polymerase sigma factor (sigma-70 family)
MPADAELLLKFQAERSNGSFNLIVQRHGPMVLRTCLRRLGNTHDAEDAAQETFAVLARKAAEIKGSLSGWLHAVAVHSANQIVRTRVRRSRREKELVHMNTRSGSSPAVESDWKEEIDCALVELPDHLREAVILRYLEGLKHEEAASRTGCAVSTTAWRSEQGLHRLRSILARRGVVLSVGSLAALLLQEAEAMAATSSAVLATLTVSTAGTTASGGSATGSLGHLGAWFKTPWIAAMSATVAAAGVATSVVLWPGATPPPPVPLFTRPAAVFDAGKQGVRGHYFALNARHLATGNTDRVIQLWDVSKPREVASLGGGPDDGAIALAFSPTQNLLATAGDAGVVKLWDLETREEVAALPAQSRPSQINSLAFSPDGKLLASGGWNRSIIVFDMTTRQQRYSLRIHAEGVMAVRFSPDGKLLASASWDGAIKIWDADSGQLLQTLTAHPSGGWIGLAFSPDGVLASGGLDRQVKIWNWAEGTVQTSLQGHTDAACAVAWSPDGSLLASGGKDGFAKLWDVATGRLLANYQGGDQVLQVQFTPDGKSFVTAGWNRSLQLWTVAAQPPG